MDSFVLDKTIRYKVISRLVLFNDTLTMLLVFILLTINYRAGLSYSLTLLLLFILISTVENVILDLNSFSTADDSLQFLNTIWRLVQSPQGN